MLTFAGKMSVGLPARYGASTYKLDFFQFVTSRSFLIILISFLITKFIVRSTMKANFLSCAILVSISGNCAVSAFLGPSHESSRASRSKCLSISPKLLERDIEEIPEEAVCLETLTKISFSKAIPGMRRPEYLDGSMVGDVGLDPLGFVQSPEDLMRNREAEMKHGRLAMLAAVGWPLSELLQKKIASIMNLTPLVDGNGRAPSFLNNFEGIDFKFWFVLISFGLVVELNGALGGKQGAFPGDLGFDPLSLYPKDIEEQKSMQLAEVKHGRLAMLALLLYSIQELVTHSGIVSSIR